MITNDQDPASRIVQAVALLNRKKVLRQLHDGLTQTVSALAMRINFARRMIETDPDAAGAELAKVEDLTRQVTSEIRHIIFLLRPEEQEPFMLDAALELLSGKMDSLFGLQVLLEIDAQLALELSEEIQRVLYAVVEEAIDSARKRNGSQKLVIIINEGGQGFVQMLIEDLTGIKVQDQPFQGAELENIHFYAALLQGSVLLEKDGWQLRLLFPLETQFEPEFPQE
jgi:signal transduction histidine kinase